MQQHTGRSLKGWHVAVVLVVLLVLLVVTVIIFSVLAGPPVRGGLRLGAALGEEGVDLYVGDRLVPLDQGEAVVTWEEILGWNGQRPLGIVLPNTAPPVPRKPDAVESLSATDAARLAGEGASVVAVKAGNPIWGSLGGSEFAKKEILLRRADGSLDQVFCVDAKLAGRFGKTFRVLIPVRVRRRAPSSSGYFTSDSSGGSYSPVPNRVTVEWGFKSTEPPEELAAEIEERGGLWMPGD